MMGKKTISFIFIVFLFVAFISLSDRDSFAEVPEKKPIAPSSPIISPKGVTPSVTPGVTIPDVPNIIEFTGEPVNFIPGQQMTFRWRVEPGAEGSPITGIRISAGGSILHTSSSASGSTSFYLSPPLMRGEWSFTLMATNRAGKSSTRTITLHAMTEDESRDLLNRSLSLRVEIIPRNIAAPASADGEFQFTVNVSLINSSSITLPGANIEVRNSIGILSQLGVLRDQTIRPGTNSYRIECSGSSRSGTSHSIYFTDTTPRSWGLNVDILYERWGRPVRLKGAVVRMVERVSYEYLDQTELH